MMTRISLAILAIVLLSLGACKPTPAPVEVKEEPKFFYGGDFSVLKKLEDHGGVYTFDGEKVDALELFAANGYNYGRVRIFHTPTWKALCNSLDYTIELSKKIKAAGMKLLLDFHYSDTWADPAHQIKPKAWENISFEALTDSVYNTAKKSFWP
jgi:arabinogalactan endo-1,4-beta-galactosidase